MKSLWLMLAMVLLICMTSFASRKEPCGCVFSMVHRRGLPKTNTFSRLQFKGISLSEREMKRYTKHADLQPGMSMALTKAWFEQHAPCGGKSFCVEQVEFAPDTAMNAVGNTILTIVVKARP